MILLIGGGGHARVLLDALIDALIRVDGVLDFKLKAGDRIFGVPVLGTDAYLDGLKKSASLVNGVGANPSTGARREVFERCKALGFGFHSVRHASAIVGTACTLMEGSQIMAGVILQPCVIVGPNAVINTGAKVDHDCNIGAHAFIGPGVVLCGNVTIGEGAFIGAGAIILPGIVVGENSIVGAGSVVLQDVAAESTVAGNPAKGR